MKDMRRFYEAWNMLDSNSAVATAELCFENSAVATAELQNSENQIDIFHTLSISNIPDFPVEDFFKVPFTHHSAIISGPKETSARFYYIHRTVEEHLSVKKLRQLIKEDAYHSQGRMPNNFTRTINNPREARRAVGDYSKPMGVATYKTLDDMPERLRKALPDMKKMMDLLKNKEE